MQVNIKVNTISIKDVESGQEFIVKTLRSANSIKDNIEETEKDWIEMEVERLVEKALQYLKRN